jgi:hypothetical protein
MNYIGKFKESSKNNLENPKNLPRKSPQLFGNLPRII